MGLDWYLGILAQDRPDSPGRHDAADGRVRGSAGRPAAAMAGAAAALPKAATSRHMHRRPGPSKDGGRSVAPWVPGAFPCPRSIIPETNRGAGHGDRFTGRATGWPQRLPREWKSTVGSALAARGAAVIDTDRVARDVLAPGHPGAQAVLEHFGPEVRGPDGSIDRQALAAIVFADPDQRVVLEAISHPLVHKEVSRRVAELGDAVIVVEIPLLDAACRDQYGFDVVVLVEVQPDIALRRAVGRGMTEDDARAGWQRSPARRSAGRWRTASWATTGPGRPRRRRRRALGLAAGPGLT